MRPMPLTADEKVIIESQARRVLKRTTAEAGLDVHLRDPILMAALADIIVRDRKLRADEATLEALAQHRR